MQFPQSTFATLASFLDFLKEALFYLRQLA